VWWFTCAAWAGSAVRIGPSAFFVLPGIEVAAERSMGPHLIGSAAVFGETIGVAGRIGAGIGLDGVTRDDLTGWYVGGRLGGWGVFERAGPTLGTSIRATAGRRMSLGEVLQLRLGAGLVLPLIVAGDSSLGRRLQPALDLQLGRVIP
jgi:hypothetical protein